MKRFLSTKLLFLIAISVIVLAGCNSNTTNPINTNTAKPEPPTLFMATSIDSTTIRLKWTGSTSESDTMFAKYVLSIVGDNSTIIVDTILKGANPLDVKNLTEGVIYTFSLRAKFTNDSLSNAATVAWSPANRFDSSYHLRIYGSASSLPSGLQFNASNNMPMALTASFGDQWDFCLDTHNGGEKVGAPSASDYVDANGDFTSNALLHSKTTDIFTSVNNVTSLDDVYDSQGMDKSGTPGPGMIDFSTATKSFVVYAKSQDGNFAKILIKANNGVLLQGTGKDVFVDLEVSYQTKPNVPFALPDSKGSKGGN